MKKSRAGRVEGLEKIIEELCRLRRMTLGEEIPFHGVPVEGWLDSALSEVQQKIQKRIERLRDEMREAVA